MSKLVITLLISLSSFATALPNLDGRIVGGEQIEITKTPYQVSVRLYKQHVCGGTLIDYEWVLTAAHCFFNISTKTAKVRVASTFRNEGGQLVKAMYTTSHEGFDNNSLANDIALIKLSEKVKPSDSVRIIPLATKESAPGARAYISGWGYTSDTNKTLPTHLSGVEVELISREMCRQKYTNNVIFDYNVCTFSKQKDGCSGDSGGPMVIKGKLSGIVSWGKKCARKGPGVYISVPAYLDWIKETIRVSP